jgi:glycosyltransferase involved in cell wall biosynthesis
LVVDGDNGFVYPSGDSAALASRLEEVLVSPELRSRMCARSLARISSWDFEADRLGLLEALSTVCTKRIPAANAIL